MKNSAPSDERKFFQKSNHVKEKSEENLPMEKTQEYFPTEIPQEYVPMENPQEYFPTENFSRKFSQRKISQWKIPKKFLNGKFLKGNLPIWKFLKGKNPNRNFFLTSTITPPFPKSHLNKDGKPADAAAPWRWCGPAYSGNKVPLEGPANSRKRGQTVAAAPYVKAAMEVEHYANLGNANPAPP